MNAWGKLAHCRRDEIRSLQNRRLHHFLNQYVYPFSPHYRRLFDQNKIDPRKIRTVEDLQNIPLTSKLDFIDRPGETQRFRDFILQPDKERIRAAWPLTKTLPLGALAAVKGHSYVEEKLRREFQPVFMTFTTGTTNRPVAFLYSGWDIRNLHVSGSRMLELFQLLPADKIVSMFPYAPHLAFWQVVFGALSSGALALSTGGGKVMGTEGNLAVIEKMQPALILGVPSYVYHVLREAQGKGFKFSCVKKIVLGASRVTPAFKAKLAEILASLGSPGAVILGTYGFTEARAAWAECCAPAGVSSGYHLYSDKEIFEVVDPKTGEAQKEGEDGELVYTALDARGSVVLRYRTGDFVKGGITHDPCPHCGRCVPRISSDITRLSDVKDLQLSKIKGSLVNLSNFDALFAEIHEVDEWQVEIRKKNDDAFDVDELHVYICAKQGADPARLQEDIKKKMVMATEVTPNSVCVIPLDQMVKRLELETANKEKRILDKRPKE